MIRLAALDAKDLEVVSALTQDAVLKVGNITRPAAGTFALEMNRFAWDAVPRKIFGITIAKTNERRRAVLHFTNVKEAKTTGLSQTNPDQVFSLLAIRFIEGETPSGTIELVFSGQATIRLSVDCVECQLTDIGAAWAAIAEPKHSV